ncbi:MAG: VTT domain-containing protein [Maricaulis sp.]|uniref:TVP38/TMEM64 family protein n=1 Tax=Maricaulis sp. TaxID=1486257 RepID=UPI00260A4199|nr:VTT domain-containing protein [Maricaulis sp.]MDM7984580.1 VTT domain-containing protein [Maricaulis sp.]
MSLKQLGSRLKQGISMRGAILLLILVLLALAFINGVTPQGLAQLLQDNREALNNWVSDHPLFAAFAYAIFYMVMVSVSLPGALWFTIGAGYLLGAGTAIPVSLFGVTVGATNIFLVARYVAGERFHERFEGRIGRFADGFRRNDFTYMILLRMTPTPFFVINVAAALLGARLKSYVVGTLIGAIAPTILYANLGAGLGELVDAGLSPGWSDLLRPSFLVVVFMALVLAIFPFLRQRWQNARR